MADPELMWPRGYYVSLDEKFFRGPYRHRETAEEMAEQFQRFYFPMPTDGKTHRFRVVHLKFDTPIRRLEK